MERAWEGPSGREGLGVRGGAQVSAADTLSQGSGSAEVKRWSRAGDAEEVVLPG